MQDVTEDDLSSEASETSDYGDSDAQPGATVLWFGKYKDTRLDKVPEWYRRCLVYWSKVDPSPNYLAWLDERQSPLSTVIWFGKFAGHEMRQHYYAPRRWRYLVNYRGGKWNDDLLEIEQRYLVWRETHRGRDYVLQGREYKPRAPAIIVHPMGEKLGPRDDQPASENDEDYDSDGGFVVSDEDDEQSVKTDEDADCEEATSGLESPDGKSNGDDADEDISERTGSDHLDSDSSVPSLADVRKASAPSNCPLTRSKVNLLGPGPGARDPENSESDTDDPTIPRPVSMFARRKRKRPTIISSSDDEDDDDDIIISPMAKRRKDLIDGTDTGTKRLGRLR